MIKKPAVFCGGSRWSSSPDNTHCKYCTVLQWTEVHFVEDFYFLSNTKYTKCQISWACGWFCKWKERQKVNCRMIYVSEKTFKVVCQCVKPDFTPSLLSVDSQHNPGSEVRRPGGQGSEPGSGRTVGKNWPQGADPGGILGSVVSSNRLQ